MSGETGASSKAIVRAVTGHTTVGGVDHPLDIDDLRRCVWLIEQHPEIIDRFDRVTAISPEWAAIILDMGTLTGLLDVEFPDWRNPSFRWPRGWWDSAANRQLRVLLGVRRW